MKPLPHKDYKVRHDFTVGSFSVSDSEKLSYYVSVKCEWLSVFEAKKLIKKLQKSLKRIADHKEMY